MGKNGVNSDYPFRSTTDWPREMVGMGLNPCLCMNSFDMIVWPGHRSGKSRSLMTRETMTGSGILETIKQPGP